jgi:transketolase
VGLAPPDIGVQPASGIEVTTSRSGKASRTASAWPSQSARRAFHLGQEPFRPVDHYIYAICSDGDLMEGILSEAASIAGHLGLGNLIYFYDDNNISIEGETRLAFSDETKKRFEGMGWHVLTIDGHDRAAIRKAIRRAQKEKARPTLIAAKTIIGWGSPKFHGTARAHGEPLGADEVKATKAALGWPQEPAFFVPPEVREEFARRTKRQARERKKWEKEIAAWRVRHPELSDEWDRYWSKGLPDGFETVLLEGAKTDKAVATRAVRPGHSEDGGHRAVRRRRFRGPRAVDEYSDERGGQRRASKGHERVPPPVDVFRGRNLHFGIREHAMGAIVNGMTLYGSFRAYGATFLIFSDYMRPSVRLAALMGVPSIFVYTHDSVFLGEDGPTHQPVEQLWSLRLIPNLTLFRPADGAEVAMAWAHALKATDHPTLIVLTRQKVDVIERPIEFDPHRILLGAYVLDGFEHGEITIVATGSEVPLAVKAARILGNARVVSAPSFELFDRQSVDYQNEVPGDRDKFVHRSRLPDGWHNTPAATRSSSASTASAPARPERIADELGFTPEKAECVRAWRARGRRKRF